MNPMGVDTRITLPENVRVSDVTRVIGIAAGLKPRRYYFSNGDGWCVDVPGSKVSTTGVPEMVRIELFGDLIDGKKQHEVFYHYECEQGGRLLNPRSTAFWIAVGKRLVDFFGGELIYNDCDNKVDYSVLAKPRIDNSPSDGHLWYNFQERLEKVVPITKEELKYFDSVAAYKLAERVGE